MNTENATLGDTKKFGQVVQLPMNYRGGSDSPLQALVAVPGVQQDSNGNISIGGGHALADPIFGGRSLYGQRAWTSFSQGHCEPVIGANQ